MLTLIEKASCYVHISSKNKRLYSFINQFHDNFNVPLKQIFEIISPVSFVRLYNDDERIINEIKEKLLGTATIWQDCAGHSDIVTRHLNMQ